MTSTPEASCDSCGHTRVPLVTYVGRLKSYPEVEEGWKKDLTLCRLCASTKVGTWMRFFPTGKDVQTDMARHMNFLGNEILLEIERARKSIIDALLVEELHLTHRVDGMTGLLDRNLKSKDSTVPPPAVKANPPKKKRPKKA